MGLLPVLGAAILYTAYRKKTLLPLAAVPLTYAYFMTSFGNLALAAAAGSVIWPWIRGGKGGKS